MRYIAVDIGASGGKVLAAEKRSDGFIDIKKIKSFKNTPVYRSGFLTWDIERIFSSILDALKEAGEADYVLVDTFGVDFVLLDNADSLVLPAVSYRDERTKSVKDTLDAKMLYERTGIQKQRFNTVYQLMSIKEENPEALEKADTLLFIADYINFLLTGKKMCEYTFASTSNMINLETRTWDDEVIKSAGLPRSIFLPLSEPGTVVGPVSDEVAKEIGYKPTVMLSPSHDTASAVYASLASSDCAFVSSGTWSLVGALLDHPVTDERSFEENLTNEASPDNKIRLIKNVMGTWLLQKLKSEYPEGTSYDEIMRNAMDAEDKGRIDVSSDRLLNPKTISEEIDQMLLENGYSETEDLAETAKVIYLSLAEYTVRMIEKLEEITGRTFSEVNIVGGGAKDRYLCDLIAMLSRKKIISGPYDATAIGSLLFALVKTGEMKKEEKMSVIRSNFGYTSYTRRTEDV